VHDMPSLICCRTVIGWGAPNKQGDAASHGSPLGAEEAALTREAIGWRHPPFEIPPDIYAGWDARARGAALESDWRRRFEQYRETYAADAAEFERRLNRRLPGEWDDRLDALLHATGARKESIATRTASQHALNGLGPMLEELIGGSADLTGSNCTKWSGSRALSADAPGGNYIYYGVREFGMAAINNGIALHGGFIPYGGTFLIFSDYARNALRMAALMKQRNIFVLTHDSIGLGEDGPTHQAVEQCASLRLIPNMSVWRPCDAVETLVAWRTALENCTGPTCLLLTRQNVRHMERSDAALAEISCGGYVLIAGAETPEAIVIATGSEVEIAVDAATRLNAAGHAIRVVSMPSTDRFDAQDPAYRDRVLPPACRRRIAVEAGIPDYWRRYVGLDGIVMGVSTFGESAPGAQVYKHFGITADALHEMIEHYLAAP
jgi:transketolase